MIEESWVINASPLILLGKLGRTDLLEQLAKQIMVEQLVESGSYLSAEPIRQALAKVGE